LAVGGDVANSLGKSSARVGAAGAKTRKRAAAMGYRVISRNNFINLLRMSTLKIPFLSGHVDASRGDVAKELKAA
jgi:hypothetical protein